jgi:hypothetical protein
MKTSSVCVFALTGILAMTQSATAGTLYKCIDAKGSSAYQETPCPKGATQAGKGYVQPVAPSRSNSWVAQRGALVQQQAGQRALIEAQSGPRIGPSYGDNSAERRDQLSSLDSQISNIGTANSRGKRELLADLEAQKTAIVTNQAVERPVGRADPAPVYRVPNPQPSTITDQNGRTYTQPPGSAFATDNATGKQCFVNGAFVHCK